MVKTVFTLLALLIATAGWACSGQGAAERMAASQADGYHQAQVMIGLFLSADVLWITAKCRLPFYPLALLFLASTHPAWWLDAYRGDCGITRNVSTVGYTILGTLLLVLQFVHLIFTSKKS